MMTRSQHSLHMVMLIRLICCILSSLTVATYGSSVYANIQTPFSFMPYRGKLRDDDGRSNLIVQAREPFEDFYLLSTQAKLMPNKIQREPKEEEYNEGFEEIDNRRLFYPFQSDSLYQNYPVGRMR